MEGFLNHAVIRGNDRDNTILLSGSVDIAIDRERYCRRTVKGHELRYKVYGWPESWDAHMRVYGEDGHDWLSGGPNADTVFGGEGDDMLRGLGGRGNRLYGQDGHDKHVQVDIRVGQSRRIW